VNGSIRGLAGKRLARCRSSPVDARVASIQPLDLLYVAPQHETLGRHALKMPLISGAVFHFRTQSLAREQPEVTRHRFSGEAACSRSTYPCRPCDLRPCRRRSAGLSIQMEDLRWPSSHRLLGHGLNDFARKAGLGLHGDAVRHCHEESGQGGAVGRAR
jgi:hypothetical protein